MAYKKSKRYSAKKIIVKPKVQWSLHRQTNSLAVYGPVKPGSDWGVANNLYSTFATKSLVEATSDSQYIPGFVKKVKHLKVEISRSFTANNDTLHQSLVKMKAYVMYHY